MQISLSNVQQSYQISGIQKYQSQQEMSVPQGPQDKMQISSEGQKMSQMLRHEENREAHKAAFQDTYESLNMEDLDVSQMTDEEKTEVLSTFEAQMAEHMGDYKPATEMTSSELDQTISGIQEMGSAMDSGDSYMQMGKTGGRPPGGPPPGGGKGAKGAEGVQGSSSTESDLVSSLIEALEDDEDDETSLFDTLVDALDSEDDESDLMSELVNSIQNEQIDLQFSYRNMDELLSTMTTPTL